MSRISGPGFVHSFKASEPPRAAVLTRLTLLVALTSAFVLVALAPAIAAG